MQAIAGFRAALVIRLSQFVSDLYADQCRFVGALPRLTMTPGEVAVSELGRCPLEYSTVKQ